MIFHFVDSIIELNTLKSLKVCPLLDGPDQLRQRLGVRRGLLIGGGRTGVEGYGQ